ncbi:MAG: hypothetical protein ACI83P_002076 [Janthinobacterium sp.]|jgi:hypothetical protein
MRMTSISRRSPALLGAVTIAMTLFSGCASKVQPDWQMNADSSITRFQQAYLVGNALVETTEFKRAREQVARTGKIDLVIRVELIRCATRVASLVFEDCAGYQKLHQDAAPPERAYARYLAGETTDAALLPQQHRPIASGNDTPAASAVLDIKDPLAALVAAGVLLRTGRASPAVLDFAVETASNQGWRRPLLAWLGVQAQRAEQAGATIAAQRLQRRIAIVRGNE